jgi:hypothetical protein
MLKIKIAAAAAVGLLLQAQAFAGSYYGQNVVVSGNVGYGSVLAARDSSDSTQSISCYVGAYVTNADITNTTANVYLSCGATDSTGKSYSCYTYNPPDTWVKMMTSMNEISWIYFYGDSAGHCQGLNVDQGSQYL